jgi:urease accessory protein
VDLETGAVFVAGVAPETADNDTGVSFPVNVAAATDEYHGGDGGFAYLSAGIGFDIPFALTVKGDPSLGLGLTYYYTDDSVIPSNPDGSIFTGTVSIGIAFEPIRRYPPPAPRRRPAPSPGKRAAARPHAPRMERRVGMAETDPQAKARWSHARVATVRGRSQLVNCRSEEPLKLLSPRVDPRVVCLVQSSYGGGFVQGDVVRFRLEVESEATVFLTSQANSHVYRHQIGWASEQRIESDLRPGALAVVLPEPIVMHRDGHFTQQQCWRLAPSATLILLDWIQSGRSESGESFLYRRFDSQFQIHRSGDLLVLDPFRSVPREEPRNPARFGSAHLLLSVYLVGPRIGPVLDAVERMLGQDKPFPRGELPEQSLQAAPSLVASLSRLDAEAGILRAAATSRRDLDPLVKRIGQAVSDPSLLGWDPCERILPRSRRPGRH